MKKICPAKRKLPGNSAVQGDDDDSLSCCPFMLPLKKRKQNAGSDTAKGSPSVGSSTGIGNVVLPDGPPVVK